MNAGLTDDIIQVFDLNIGSSASGLVVLLCVFPHLFPTEVRSQPVDLCAVVPDQEDQVLCGEIPRCPEMGDQTCSSDLKGWNSGVSSKESCAY